jgi:hypothetical protein
MSHCRPCRQSAPDKTAFALLLALRLTHALGLRTFLQPDIFLQSLEPSWQLAFGDATGARITWAFSRPFAPGHPGLNWVYSCQVDVYGK